MQEWKEGNVVRIGFLGNFLIVKKVPTPGDHMPDKYLVLREHTKQFYYFTPHYGLSHVDGSEAKLEGVCYDYAI